MKSAHLISILQRQFSGAFLEWILIQELVPQRSPDAAAGQLL